jgi:hypothetical protein
VLPWQSRKKNKVRRLTREEIDEDGGWLPMKKRRKK